MRPKIFFENSGKLSQLAHRVVEKRRALRGERKEMAPAMINDAPAPANKTPSLKPMKQWIKRALFNQDAPVCDLLAQGIAVMGLAERCEYKKRM